LPPEKKQKRENTNTHFEQREKGDYGWFVGLAVHEDHQIKFVTRIHAYDLAFNTFVDEKTRHKHNAF
jgi:beta-lactamase class D